MTCNAKDIPSNVEKTIRSAIAKDRLFEKRQPPVVDVFPENGEIAIKIQSLLDKTIENKIKKHMDKNMDKDVLLFNCLGNASIDGANVDLNCNIITENGIPVKFKRVENNEELVKIVHDRVDGIVAAFQSERARCQSLPWR
jgi:hypothetical protein